MSKSDNRGIKIYLDTTDYKQGIDEIVAQTAKYKKELQELESSGKGTSKTAETLRTRIESLQRQEKEHAARLKETARILGNLSGATYNELLAAKRKLQAELRLEQRGTERYNATLVQYKKVCAEVTRAQREMRVEVGCQGTVWGRAAGFVNKYIGLLGGLLGTVTGFSLTLRRSVDDYAQMSEVMAGVKKYTGMADEAVKDLNESLKLIDTRTSRERLNELAQDAGRLGLKGKRDILEFVEAADMINVALGEDLGADAVKNIGKLAQMFGEDKTLGLRGAMLATGSAINEVAQNSSAAEPYLVDFTARLAGTGKQAGISQTAIMGYASVLDQDMQQVEMSATALQSVIMKVYQEPAKFARMAGKDVREFTDLLKKDANEAILQLLENLGAKGGLQQLAPIFKEMKLDGVRASGVLNTLAANTDRIRQEQERANTAYKEGTSIINEFNVQNNTVKARLEKAKKAFHEVSVELGEKLQPLMSHAISAAELFVRALNLLIGILGKYSSVLAPLAATIAAYTLASKAQIIEEKLKVFWTEKVIAAMKRMYAVMMRNPYLAVAAAVVTLITALRNMNKELSEAERMEKMLTGIRDRASESVRSERSEVEQLLSVARDENRSKAEREAAIRRLNDLSPEYLGSLSLETINTEQATRAVNSYIDSLLTLEEIKQAKNKINELNERKEEIRKNGVENSIWEVGVAKAANILNQLKLSAGFTTDAWADHVLDKFINKGVNELRSLDREIQALNGHIEESREKLIQLEAKRNAEKKTVTTGGTGEDKEKDKLLKARLEKEKMRYEREQSELKKIYLAGNDETLQTEKQFQERMLLLKEDYLRRSISAAGAGTKEGIAFQNQLDDLKLEQKRAALQKQIDEEKAAYERQQQELKELYASGKDENLDSEAAYNDAMEQLAILHLERMLSISGLSAEQQKQIQRQLTDFKVKCVKEEQAAQKKAKEEENKKIEEQTKKEQQQYRERLNTYKQYGEEFGNAVGAVIAGQENAMQAFADTMIDILFDILGKIVEAEIAKATATAVSAQARATAEAMAMPDSVATFGASGATRAAVLTGLIMASLAAARSALKGMVGRSSGSDSSGSPTSGAPEAPKRAAVTVSQWASGRYNVIGEDDGLPYRDVPYIGPAPTGIVRRTSLVSETGAELIVNAEDLARLQKHINYPLVLSAINDARSGHVPQRAAGNYGSIDTGVPPARPAADPSPVAPSDLAALVRELQALVRTLRNLKAYVTLSDIRRAEEIDEKARKPFTRSEH